MTRGLLSRNISLKIAALALSVVLWLFVTSRGQNEMALTVPIEYVNIPSGLEIAKHTVRSANLVLRAHERLGRNIRQETVRVFVDVGRAKEGEMMIPIRKDDVKLPSAATVVKIEPPTVKIVFESTISKKVAVVPIMLGSPESGYSVKAVEVRPKEIVIEGGQAEVKKVHSVKTEPVDITGITEDQEQEVGLALSEGIRSGVSKVEVLIKVGRRH